MARMEIHAAGRRTHGGKVRALCGLSVARKNTGKGGRVTCSLCQVVAARAAESTKDGKNARGGGRR
jgi:hypothetical protein